MKSSQYCGKLLLSTVIVAATAFAGRATVFFNDTFGSGSTIGSATPAAPTANSTAYQLSSSKAWVPNPPQLNPGDLKFGIASTTSGGTELQALFTSTPVSLATPGDFVRMSVTFTNTGLLTSTCLLGFGLYNGSQVQPVAGGLNGTAVNSATDHANGGVQDWQGYWSQTAFTGASSRIVLRVPQTAGTDNRDQNLTSTGSGSQSYGNPGGATIGTASTGPSLTLVAGQVYTVVLTIELTDVNTLAITNTYYSGADTNGTMLSQMGASASGTSYTGATFDGLGIGWRAGAAVTGGTAMDISSITVDGSVTVITTPPTITQEPVDVTVATGGSCPFTVAASGVNVSYQWYRNGASLQNGGNISGATSPMLIVNNASAADAFSGANGYFCVVTGQGNYSTNSTTNALTLVASTNLFWSGGGSAWDVNNSGSWTDGTNAGLVFNYGDPVNFDDTGAGNPLVTLTGNYLSASKWTVAGSTAYAFSGSGSFAGPGTLVFNSGASGTIQMNVVNTHTGGTIVSNSNPSLNVYLQQYQVLGSGPLTFAKPGMMEIFPLGSATLGIPGDVIVNDDFKIQFDGSGSFAGVILGGISGTAGKTLTLVPQTETFTNRYRVYGENLVCDVNIAIDPSGNSTPVAQYNGTVLAPYAASPATQTFNGVISGIGGLVQRGSGTTILTGANTYAGGTTPTTGSIGIGNNSALGTGVINIAPETGSAAGSGTLFAYGGARTIANQFQYPSATNSQTLIIGGTNAITFTSGFDLNGADLTGTNRTFRTDNSGGTTFSGVISDSSANSLGINKIGTNTLYLNGANTYLGLTTVSNGTLAGVGSLAGGVTVLTNSAIGGGAAGAIGALTVGGNLTLNGNGFFRLNKSLSPARSNDFVSVNGTLSGSGTGTITVTNLGPTIAVGDTFKLFINAVTGAGSMAVKGAGMNWQNNLAVDGSITALSVNTGVATNPTNIIFSISGTNLSFSWPADHLGWTLQEKTNNLAATNGWFDIPNSSTTTNVVVPINPNIPTGLFRMSLQP